MKNVKQLFKSETKKLFVFAIVLLLSINCLAQENVPDELKTKAMQAQKLWDEGKYNEYLNLINEALIQFPQMKSDILPGKLKVLEKLERQREAIQVIIELDKLEGANDITRPCDLAWRYSIANDPGNAYKWAKISADRGLQNYRYYNSSEDFKALQGHPKFSELIQQIKGNTGLGMPAKQFVGKDLSGNEISLKKYFGKVVIIDFWFLTCPPCLAELPNFQKLYLEYKEKGLEIISINIDKEKDREKLKLFLQENKIEWPTIFSGLGWKDDINVMYGVKMVPATWVVDKKGVVRYSQIVGNKLRDAIEELIKE